MKTAMKTMSRRVPAVMLAFVLAAAGGATAVAAPGAGSDGFSPVVPALPGPVVRALPGQIVRALPGQIVPALPGQLVRPLPGQVVSALPGQTVPPLPGQVGRRVLRRPLDFAKPGPLWARTAVVMR